MPPLIGIDGRGLFQKNPTGIAKAFAHIYKNLIDIEPKLDYLIWNNQWKKTTPIETKNIITTRLPNIFLHYGLWAFLPQPTLNFLINSIPIIVDRQLWEYGKITKTVTIEPRAWWLPNIAQVRVQPKTKYLLTLHDLSFVINPKWYPLRKQLWHKFLRLKKLLNDATYIVCVSNEVKHSAMDLYKIPEKKLFVGRLAPTSFVVPSLPRTAGKLDTGKVGTQTKAITQNSEFKTQNYYLHLASNFKRKNTDGVIAAYKIYRALSENPNDLILVGDYKLKENIAGIKVLPYQLDETLPRLFQNATALLYPSWYESFGLPVLEAQKNNCPVIGSAVGSLPEIGANSILYAQPWDTVGLAKLMAEFENNIEWQNKLREAGQKNIQEYSWSKTAQLYHYLFWEILK